MFQFNLNSSFISFIHTTDRPNLTYMSIFLGAKNHNKYDNKALPEGTLFIYLSIILLLWRTSQWC